MCNCNGLITKPKDYISQTRVLVRKIWEKSQFEEKPTVIKKINKT